MAKTFTHCLWEPSTEEVCCERTRVNLHLTHFFGQHTVHSTISNSQCFNCTPLLICSLIVHACEA